MKRTISTAVMSVSLVMSAQAGAQQVFGDQGQFIVSADRVMGYTHDVQTVEPDAPDAEVTVTSDNFAFLGQGDVLSEFMFPRVSFDYTVIDGLTLGGSLAFWTQSGETETQTPFGSATADNPTSTFFVFAPRIGYIFMFSEHVGIWPRGGFSFFTGSTEDPVTNGDISRNGFGFNVDVPFAFVPLEHTAIYVGPGFDVSLGAGGETDPGNTEYNLSILDFGIYAGLGIWF